MSSASRVFPSSSFLEWFTCRSPSILVLDGGVSTYLEHRLAQRNAVFSHRELWSSSLLLDGLDEDVIDCHTTFAAAGADVLSTITYQCHYGIASATKTVDDKSMTRMIHKGIALAKACTNGYVAASLGCYGAALADGSEYRGDYMGVTREMLHNFHSRRIIEVLLQQPDAIAFETVPNLAEVVVLAELVQETPLSGVSVWISLACCNDHQLNDGTELELVFDELRRIDPTGAAIKAIGFNCGHVKYIAGQLRSLTRHMATKGPKRAIVIYPNSGEEWDAKQACWKTGTGCTSPSQFADEICKGIQVVEQTWTRQDAPMPHLIVGGCCRTSPETIAAIRRMVDNREADR
jgi:homocysteine S-methyltransferase